MEHLFNLIDESWLRVLTNDCRLKEISLKDALINAHNIADLSGETRAQDIALLRFLVAIMHTVFSRYGLNGEDINLLEGKHIPLNQWQDMWQQGYIPSAPIDRYFAEWHDRFWLFDEQYPFYQSNIAAEKGAYFSTAKMIGTLFESKNKKRLFSARSGKGIELSYSEVARWLIHLNCFDDIAAKYNNAAEGLKKQVPVPAWVSRLGLIALKGKNLFETILLNFRADYDVEEKSVYKETPSWEQDNQNPKFNRDISVPNNQAALLSLMSRRICLKREGNIVAGYYIYGGDFIGSKSVENGKIKNLAELEIFDEQMTLWSAYQEEKDKQAENGVYHFRPKLLDSSISIWREFGSIAGMDIIGDNKSKYPSKKPGVISWLDKLYGKELLDYSYMVNVVTVSVIYDKSQPASLPVKDAVANSMNLHAQLLSDAGKKWQGRILIEIKNCESADYYIGKLYKELQFAVGRRDKDTKQDKDAKTEQSGEAEAKMRFYAAIDRPFRDWLEGLTVEQDYDSSVALIERTIRDIAVEFGRALARQSGNRAVFGRASNTKREKESEKMSSAKSLSTYYAVIRKIFKLGESNDEDKQSGSDL